MFSYLNAYLFCMRLSFMFSYWLGRPFFSFFIISSGLHFISFFGLLHFFFGFLLFFSDLLLFVFGFLLFFSFVVFFYLSWFLIFLFLTWFLLFLFLTCIFFAFICISGTLLGSRGDRFVDGAWVCFIPTCFSWFWNHSCFFSSYTIRAVFFRLRIVSIQHYLGFDSQLKIHDWVGFSEFQEKRERSTHGEIS